MTYKQRICYEHGIEKVPTVVINFSERLVVDPKDISGGFYEAVENWCPLCLRMCDIDTNEALGLLYNLTTARVTAMNNIEKKDIYSQYMNTYLGLLEQYKAFINVDERTEKDA